MRELTDDRLHFIVAQLSDGRWHHLAGPAPLDTLNRVLPGWIAQFPSARIVTAPLRAAASTSTEGAGVKGLVWRGSTAESAFGDYAVERDEDDSMAGYPWVCWSPADDGTNLGHFDTKTEAQDAAQADYEARIRSALNPPAPKVTTDEAEERG